MDFKIFELSKFIIILFTSAFLDWTCEGRIYRDHVFHESHVKGGILYIGNNLDWLQKDSAHFRRYGFSSILVEINNKTELERFFTGNFSSPPLLEDSTNTSIILVCNESALFNSTLLTDLLKKIPSGKKEKEDFRNSYFGRISSIIVYLRSDFYKILPETRFRSQKEGTDETNMCQSLKKIGGQMKLLGILLGLGFSSPSNLDNIDLITKCSEQEAPNNFISILLLDGEVHTNNDSAFHYDKFSRSFDDSYKNLISIVKKNSYNFNAEVIMKAKWNSIGEVKPWKDEFSFLRKYGQIISQFIYTWGHLRGRRVTFAEIPENIGGLDSWLNYTVSYSSPRNSVYKPVVRYMDRYQYKPYQIIPTRLIFPALCKKYDEIIIDVEIYSDLGQQPREFGKFLSQLMNGSCNSQISVSMSKNKWYVEMNTETLEEVLNQTLQAALTSPGYLKSVIISTRTTCDRDFSGFIKFVKYYTDKWQRTNYSNLSIGVFGHCLHSAGDQVNATREMFDGTPIRLGFVRGKGEAVLSSNAEQSLDVERLTGSQDEIFLEKILPKNGNCQKYKVYWTTTINRAFLYGYKVLIEATDICCFEECKDVFWNPYNEGFKFRLVDELASSANSSFEEICVMIDEEVPTSLIPFDRSLSGVSLNMTQSFYQGMRAKQLATLLQLIHVRFDRIEIMFDCGEPRNCLEMVKLFQGAVFILEELVGPEKFIKFKYYFNLESLSKTSCSQWISHLKFIESTAVQGIHFELSMSSTTDFEAAVDLLRKNDKPFGVALDIGTMENPTSLLSEKLVPLCDYVIINFRIFDILAVTSGGFIDKTIPSATEIYTTMNSIQFESSFHELFDILRVYRSQCEQVNKNITVILRVRWPTLTRGEGGDSTEGFNLNYPGQPIDGSLWYPQKQYLRIWKFIQEYSSTFNFPIFIDRAFDDEESDGREKDYEKYLTERFGITEGLKFGYGWWTIHNYSDVTNISTISEKQADYLGIPTDRPKIETEEKPSENGNIYIGVAAGVLSPIVLVIFVVIRYKRGKYPVISKQEIMEFKYGKVLSSVEDDDDDKEELSIFGVRYDKEKYEIRKKDFSNDLSCVIGEGNFGKVYKMETARFKRDVAVKIPNESDASGTQTTLRSLLHEIKIMSYVGEHRNILTLLGAYTKEIHKGMVWVVTDFCEHGCLLKLLRKAEEDKSCELTYELYRYCNEIASGMAYLAEKRVIHGDLAARNVLLDKDYTCKISDFGLSRMLKEQYSEYVKKSKEPLPWAWLAPESLKDFTFTLKSDVWSIGITFWEVFSFGDKPYSELTWDVEFYGKLVNGMRLPKPDGVDHEIYALIRSCWELEPNSRPDPRDLGILFQKLRNKLYKDLNEIETREQAPPKYVNCE